MISHQIVTSKHYKRLIAKHNTRSQKILGKSFSKLKAISHSKFVSQRDLHVEAKKVKGKLKQQRICSNVLRKY